MTTLLLRLFVKNYENTTSSKVRFRVGRLSGVVSIICNLLLFSGKLLAGILSGAVSIIADAMNNLSDAVSSIVTLVGFKLAERPADEDHPYGHARYEYLSGLAVAGLILVIGFDLAKTSVGKIFDPTAVLFSAPTVIILVCSVLVKLWLSAFNRRLGRHIDSQALLAVSVDSRNDVIATTAVLAAGIIEWITSWRIDGYIGLAVALFILYSGISMAKETISPLLGETASPELRKLIVDVVTGDPRVLGYHDLMVHDYGPGQRFASLHVEMDQREDALVCHEIIDNLERRCLQQHRIHLVIHYDPVAVGEESLNEMRELVLTALQQQDHRLTLHDFRMVQTGGHTNLIFDVALPFDLKGQERQIKRTLDEALAALDRGRIYMVITFDPEAFNKE